MAFVTTQRVSGFLRLRERSMLSAGRVLAKRLRARCTLAPQERANLYVSRMPIAVITASLGGHPASGSDDRAR
jgi:hypothetical protein